MKPAPRAPLVHHRIPMTAPEIAVNDRALKAYAQVLSAQTAALHDGDVRGLKDEANVAAMVWGRYLEHSRGMCDCA